MYNSDASVSRLAGHPEKDPDTNLSSNGISEAISILIALVKVYHSRTMKHRPSKRAIPEPFDVSVAAKPVGCTGLEDFVSTRVLWAEKL